MERTRTAWLLVLLASMGPLARVHAQTTEPSPSPAPEPAQAIANGAAALPELSLSEAIDTALAHNSTWKTAQLETERMTHTLAAAGTRRYASTQLTGLGAQLVTRPSLTFPAGSLGSYAATGPIPSTNQKIEIARRPAVTINLLVAQPLSTQYQLHLELSALASGLDGTRAEQNQTRKEVVDQVLRAYYAVIEAQSALDTLEASLPLYRESQRLARENRERETILASDLLNADAELLKLTNAISDAQDRVASASEHLNDLMGRDVRTRFRVTSTEAQDVDHTDVDALESQALRDRPEIAKARAQERQAAFEARAKKAEFIPELNLAFAYYTTANFDPVLPRNIGTLGLSMKWEPWDWGRKRQELAAKRTREQQAGIAVDATERSVRLDVRNAARQLDTARRQLALSDAQERTSRQKLTEVQEQFGHRSALSRDLFAAQSALAAADDKHEQALAAFWSARADLKKAMGDE